MTYEEWERTVPPEITGDVVWHLTAYRLALFAADLGWRDVTVLGQDTGAPGDCRTSCAGRSVPSARTSKRGSRREPVKIGHASMNTHWDQHAKAGAGITKADICWRRKWHSTACGC